MAEIDFLSEKTRARLPEFVSSDLTHSEGKGGDIIFLTHVFKDGFLLGFWSHSPWGRVNNMEKGWAVINLDGKIEDMCATVTNGEPAQEDFREWRKDQKELHGAATKLCEEFTGEMIWKLTET